ncbi:MAG: hypothetical protein KH246_04520 [Collinsella sp.]|nr:hypothetical protein [Collinsella sp.]
MEQAVVPLRVEQPRLVEPCQLELVVDVGSEDEVVPPFEDVQKVEVGLTDPRLVAVEQDGSSLGTSKGEPLKKRPEGALFVYIKAKGIFNENPG